MPKGGEKLPLPDGSRLKGVMLPRYDENRKLVGVLKAQTITLVNEEQMAGDVVSIEFFNDDQTPRGRIDLAKATLYQKKNLLTAKESVKIKSDRMTASGTGLHYAFERGEGFLMGPATTTIETPTETTMNTKNPSLRATAVLGMSLLTLSAAPPPEITAAEKAATRKDAISMAPVAQKAGEEARAAMKIDAADSETASKAAAAFLVQADLPPIPAEDTDPVPAPPVDLAPGPGRTVIKCDGGMYFDADEGVLVYLKNVTVTDPRFDLSGANEVKVFFGKKPEKKPKAGDPPAKEDKNKIGGKIGAGFGDVERIVATGAVLIEQKAADGKDPIRASGRLFTYNIKADQVVISGGSPWVVNGKQALRATQPGDFLRLSPKAGTMRAEGHWTTILNLEEKK